MALASSALLLAALSACGSSGPSTTNSSTAGSQPASSSSSSTSQSSSTTSSGSGRSAAASLSTRQLPGLGAVLVDGRGHTLYTFSPDGAKHVSCLKSCAEIWPPLKLGESSPPKLSGGARSSLLGSDPDPDGGRVVTYAGWPLYSYVADTSPGQATGQGLNSSGGLWYVISPTGHLVKAES